MSVGFNSNIINFKSSNISEEKPPLHNEKLLNEPAADNKILESDHMGSFELAQEHKPDNKKTFKQKLASIAKFFTATEEITKGTAKGAIYGTLAGGTIMGAGWLFGALPRGFKKGNSLVQVFKHPFKAISSKTKITAGITAIGIAAYHIVRGNLQANLHKAFIDKKLNNN